MGLKKAAMEDSKLNRAFDAAGKGARRAASAASGALSRLRLWQKAGLILCAVFWILSAVIGAVLDGITSTMPDQTYRSRWSPEGNCAQISTYLSESAAASDDTVKELRAAFSNALQSESIALTEKQIENGASLMDDCYCGIASADVSTPDDSVSVTMIGVGGDFFNFHPLELQSGYYFSEEELMRDRVLLDDQTAWRLFGSPDVVGLSVQIGGEPHYIAGVFKRPEGRFYSAAGMGDYLIFASYESLCKYTEKGATDGGGDGDGAGGSLSPEASIRDEKKVDAGMPAQVGGGSAAAGKAFPAAAAWRFVSGDAAVLYALEDTDMDSGSDSDTDSSEEGADSGTVEEKTEPEDLDDHMSDSDRGASSGSSPSGVGDEDQKEVDRSRLTVYEVILPDPVTGFALKMVRGVMTEAGISSEQMTIVDNSARYETTRLALLAAEPGLRSMQTAAIRYPYWENVALAWEDLLIPYALFQLILRFSPFLFLLYLVLWYATHKSWTLGGIIRNVQDEIYDRQSEKIYGRRPGAALEADNENAVTASGENISTPGVEDSVTPGLENKAPAGEESAFAPGLENKAPAGEENALTPDGDNTPAAGGENDAPAGSETIEKGTR